MLTRILTALIGVVVFFAVLFAPPAVFGVAVCVVTAVMLFELYGVIKCGRGVNVAGILSAIVITLGAVTGKSDITICISVIIYLFAVILTHTKIKFTDVMSHGFVTLFVTLFMSFIPRLFAQGGIYDTLWIFIIAWLTDTGAYFAGVTLGKHKLVPHISPKKTVEGAIGGVFLCVLGCFVYTAVRHRIPGVDVTAYDYVIFAAMGLLGSVLSQFGDFVASCIKRDMDTKDYGSILPGHGGMMDRFDSVVFVAPFVYCVINTVFSIK